MGIKIVISTARKAKEKEKVIEALTFMDQALSTFGDRDKRIEFIYDCEKKSTIFGELPKQTEINDGMIPKCDWLIMLAPLKHVGDKTASELKAAYKALMSGEKLVINVVYCKTPFGKKTEEDYQKALKANNCEMLDTDVLLSDLIQSIKDEYNQDFEQYGLDYNYDSEYSSLVNKINKEFNFLLLENRFPVFHVDGLAKFGSAVKAKELYYDKNRASEKNGFNESLYCPRKSVDTELQNKIEEGCRMMMITGMPGSGKTRAVYEYVRHGLADEKVVLLNSDNIRDLMKRFKTDVDYNMQERKREPSRLYLVADQVRDVFEMAGMDSKEIREFYETLFRHRNLVFIGTSIKAAYENFRKNNPKVVEVLQNNANLCHELEIRPIGKGQADVTFVNWLKTHFKSTSGVTVGDYIPRLNDYVDRIVKRLVKQKEDELTFFVRSFIKACQLVTTFRYSSPLCLVVMLMHKEYEKMSDHMFAKNVLACIKYMTENNVVWFSGELGENMFNWKLVNEYDGEKMLTIVPPTINFTFNELVWEALVSGEAKANTSDRLLYDWNSPDEAKNAIMTFYETFPTPKSLSRMVARLPRAEANRECIGLCVEIARNNWDVLSAEDMEEMNHFYNLLVGRASSRREVRRIVSEMKKLGLAVNESTVGEMIRFVKWNPDSYTREEIEEFQQENNIADSCYSIYRKIECFTDNFEDAFALVEQGKLDAVFGKVQDVEDLFVIDMLSLQRIYGILARLCSSPEQIRRLVDYADAKYAWAMSMVEELRGYDDVMDVLEIAVENIFEDASKQLDTLDSQGAKALLRGFVDSMFALSNSTVYFLIGKSYQNTPMLQLLHSYLEAGKGVWASVKANYREIAYVGLIQKSEDFSTAYAFYQSWRNPSGEHNARMLAMCLENCKKHEYKQAVKAFNAFEKAMGGPDNVSLILYNQMLKISPTVDDASLYIRRLPYADDYTLSNLLRIVDSYKVTDKITGRKMPSPKRFLYAYEVVNMPQLRRYRYDIHVFALLMKMAESLKQEEYVWHLIKDGKSENESLGMKRMVEASDEINTMRINKSYRSIDESFAILDKVREAADGGKMAPDCLAALCGKIALCQDEEEREKAFCRWDEFVEENGAMIEKDEFFYSAVYRFRRLENLFDATGEVSEEFRRSMEGVKASQARNFCNLLSTMLKEGVGFEKMWRFFQYYLKWYEKNKAVKTLVPYRNFFMLLEKAAGKNPEWNQLVACEKEKFCQQSKADTSNSIFLHGKFRQSTCEEVFEMLQQEIDGGFLMPTVLNSGLENLAKSDKRHKVYHAVMDFVARNPEVVKLFTPLTHSALFKLASDYQEKLRWLYPEQEEPLIEKLLGMVATDEVVAANDITITRRYFDLWKSIYDDLGYDSEGNFQTLSGYLRAEIENRRDGYLERIRMVVKIYVDNGRPIWGDTFRGVPWSRVCAELTEAYPDERHIWERVEILLLKKHRP